MKTLKLLALASFATFAGFAATADADAALPKRAVKATKSTRPVARRGKATRIVAKPDLRCTIQAYKDAAGMQPVANGQALAWGGGAPKVYIRVIVENGGAKDATNFKNVVSIKRNGSSIFSANETLTLPKGLAKMYPLVAVNLPGTSNQITANISADGTKTVSETNEYNNSCSFSVSASVVH